MVERRALAAAGLEGRPLPSEKEEVWRYSPIDELDLAAYAPAPVPAAVPPMAGTYLEHLLADLPGPSAVVLVVDGTVMSLSSPDLPAGVSVGGADPGDRPGAARQLVRPGSVLEGGDALVRLNDAFAPDAVVVDVGPGCEVEAPVLVVHWCSAGEGDGPAPASFPRTAVRLGEGARAALVEVVAGPGHGGALVVPVTELEVGEGAHLSHAGLQVLGGDAWSVARTAARVGAGGTLHSFWVGLGARYDRCRVDAQVTGPGAATRLHSAYLGQGHQVHDVRTQQDHLAPRTTSELLCKGAVAGAARSVYTGMIRIRHGAVRSEAVQTNNNLVLSPEAHADSVPNLDIAENDVRCAHASTIGPVDSDQRYYVESRGVPPEEAERLIVLGFFDDMVERCPVPGAVPRIRAEVGLRLAAALDVPAGEGPA